MPTKEDLFPAAVPVNLNQKEYYELGVRYRLAGLVGRAKEALKKSCDAAPASQYARKAELVLKTQLPLKNVPELAEQKNIEAYNLMSSDPLRAKEVLEQLMAQHPDFEWPFLNYASLLLSENNADKARSLMRYLLSLNPENLSSLRLAIQTALRTNKLEEALELAQRAVAVSGDDPDFEDIAGALNSMQSGEPPDTIPEDLSPREYYELGKRYDMFARFELSRECFNRAIKNSADEIFKQKVQLRIKTHLPVHTVPAELELRLKNAAALAQSDLNLAKDELQKLEQAHPELESAAMGLAVIFMQERDWKNALYYADRVLSIHPDCLQVKILKAQVLLRQEQFEQALALIDSMVPEDQRSMSLDLLKAQCELALYEYNYKLHH